MLEFSKRRRMQIVEQIEPPKDRVSSVERRKKAENMYNNFVQTMSNFNAPSIQSSNNSSVNKTTDFKELKKVQKNTNKQINGPVHPVLATPTVKDIMPQPSNQTSLNKQFYELEYDPQTNNHTPPKANESNVDSKQLISKQEIKQNPINLNHLIEEHSSQRDSEPPVEDQQIKIPQRYAGNSAKTESNNNSEAIFFTSQFKDYIGKQSPQKQLQPKERIDESQQLISPRVHFQKQAQKQQQAKQANFSKNQSGRSNAGSNESSLKYSFNQSAIQQIITKKLSNELIIDSLGDSQYTHIIKRLAMTLCFKQNIKDLILFSKQLRANRMIKNNSLLKVFDNLLINRELLFELKKGDIKAGNFRQQKQINLIQKLFETWRAQTLSKKAEITDFMNRQNLSVLDKVFRSFKMLLYDRRINNQIDTYYLSKIFFAFKTTVEKQTKKINQRAYRLYFKNLKKRMFLSLVQGAQNSRRERQINDLARDQYYFSLVGRVFQAWKDSRLREEKVIRLSMTTKNTLKQTSDHRLFQTQTVDFHQIK